MAVGFCPARPQNQTADGEPARRLWQAHLSPPPDTCHTDSLWRTIRLRPTQETWEGDDDDHVDDHDDGDGNDDGDGDGDGDDGDGDDDGDGNDVDDDGDTRPHGVWTPLADPSRTACNFAIHYVQPHLRGCPRLPPCSADRKLTLL